jgi:muramoyltetrapeptide carboxypeptidase LdcA involved in peptidoglycan recycling
MFGKKLKKGDSVRVISPASSLASDWISAELKAIASNNFKQLGLKLSFSENVNEIDDFGSSSIQSRVNDIHQAFLDKSIQMIITTYGGFNANQLLKYLDYDLIRNNPKILCGHSDINVLSNAIFAKTGLVGYSGPHFTSFGNKLGFDFTQEYFQQCFFSEEVIEVYASKKHSDDDWALDQNNRTFLTNKGHCIINEGYAEGVIIGGNLCTLNLLQGTEYMPTLKNSILFLEDDYEVHPGTVDRDLQSLIHLDDFKEVKAIVFGRFQNQTNMTDSLLNQIVKSKSELDHIPIISNVDFGHTTPLISYPIGGKAQLNVSNGKISLNILEH